jgi:hypothetical protein
MVLTKIQKRDAGLRDAIRDGKKIYMTVHRRAELARLEAEQDRLREAAYVVPPEGFADKGVQTEPMHTEPEIFREGDLVHIKPEFWSIFDITPDMRCKRLRVTDWSRGTWTPIFVSGPWAGHTLFHRAPEAALVRA